MSPPLFLVVYNISMKKWSTQKKLTAGISAGVVGAGAVGSSIVVVKELSNMKKTPEEVRMQMESILNDMYSLSTAFNDYDLDPETMSAGKREMYDILLENVQKVFLYEFESNKNSYHFLDVKSFNEENRERFENNNQEYFELKLSQEENYYNQQITAIKRFSIELENDFSIDETMNRVEYGNTSYRSFRVKVKNMEVVAKTDSGSEILFSYVKYQGGTSQVSGFVEFDIYVLNDLSFIWF